ncbi:hypothetical protein [Corynebacterium lowii]|uniref:Beta-lactamase enzyme family protein n=1 Tax=Corynebacterium lowii TaxID=1544413 RepID=A0A0Q0YEK0_9CORY|nr:hypothetical protein [Corynebacterium lowii]KQB84807.1 hypothetical protein Clow_02068 [Corynebacterium lowii]
MSRHGSYLALPLCALALTSCTIGEVEQEQNSAAPSSSTTASPTTAQQSPELTALPGTAVALADATGTHTAGDLSEAVGAGPAWSTSKVPLAVAALRAFPEDAQVAENVRTALTASDNEAAAFLWEALGTPEEAGAAVEAVLREGGDDHTRVETRKVRPEFSAFGQTHWAVADQAAFATALPDVKGAQPVLEAMGQVIPEQSYGLGTIEGMRFKGGWGPGVDGAYTARQMGVLSTPCGVKGAALVARPQGGTYEEAQALLTQAAEELAPHLRCS